MSSGNNFHFGSINQVASGAGSVNQIGNNVATTNVSGQQIPTVDQVFSTVADSLPEEVAEEMKASVIEPLEKLAALPPEDQQSDDVKEQAEPLYQRLVPYAPQIGKGLLTFGEAALSTLASSNPIVAGLLAVCRTVRTLETPAAASPSDPSSPPADSQIA